MKSKAILLICSLIILFGCKHQSNKDLFKSTSWYYLFDGKENIAFTSNEVFLHETKWDTIQNKMIQTGSVLKTNYLLTDSSISYIYKYKQKDKDTTINVISKYDLISINNKILLVIYNKASNDKIYASCYSPKDKIDLKKSTNNLTSLEFKIKGYSIGDTVDIKKWKLIKSETQKGYGSGDYILDEYQSLSDEKLNIKVIGHNYIYEIKQLDINDNEIDNIKNVVSKKVGKKADCHDYKIDTGNGSIYAFTSCYWFHNSGTNVILSHNEDIYGIKNWELKLENEVKTSILCNVFSQANVSSIIE
jgi:hypothetical protein